MTITNFDATTPQSKTVKSILEAYISLDLSNADQFFSKDFKFQTFPKISDLPEEVKEAHFDRYGPLFALMAKVEVCVQNRLLARRLTSAIPRLMSTK